MPTDKNVAAAFLFGILAPAPSFYWAVFFSLGPKHFFANRHSASNLLICLQSISAFRPNHRIYGQSTGMPVQLNVFGKMLKVMRTKNREIIRRAL